jgi:membrane protein DedA with SNARE-associated domain
MTHFVRQFGEALVFVVVFFEVAGLPFIPGETALIAAAVLAQQGHLSILWVIVAAIGAAVAGAATGYILGRWQGRRLLSWLLRGRGEKTLDRSEEFFGRHGGKAVFLARFVPILRATVGWIAGIGEMNPLRFMAWNVLGAVVWGIGIGLAAFYAGKAAVETAQRYGAIGIGGVIVLVALVAGGMHVWRRRMEASS